MAFPDPRGWLAAIAALPAESRARALIATFAVALGCALVVSTAAVVLQPKIDANLAAERQARLDAMIAEMPGLADLLAESGADRMETLAVDLATGTRAGAVPEGFLPTLAQDPDTSTEIAPEDDAAGIGRRPDVAQIHVLRDGEALRLVILPVFGAGYQSTIQAYLALEGDLNTVAALAVTDQGETPGLGAKIAEPAWQALWPGKELRDEDGTLRLEVVRGKGEGPFEVDGITGATRTSNAVSGMIAFWMGPEGYGPVLDALREGGL